MSREPGNFFEAAVRQIFRHLHEPHILRQNSLTKHFFHESADPHADVNEDSAALRHVHHLVLKAAEYCRLEDVSAGKDERAYRQYTIVLRQCLGRKPIEEVAQSLGISCAHCYRERAEICQRIGQRIFTSDRSPAATYHPELDTFQVALRQVSHGAAFSERNASLDKCDELYRTATTPAQRIEALKTLSLIALYFGNGDRALSSLRKAKVIHSYHFSDIASPAAQVAQALIDLVGSKLAHHYGDVKQALESAKQSVLCLESILKDSPDSVRELYAEAVYELAKAVCNDGDFRKGHDLLMIADRHLRSVRAPSALLRVNVASETWALRNNLVAVGEVQYTSVDRLYGLSSVFEEAYGFGFMSGAAGALLGLMDYHTYVGNDTEALHSARAALLLADGQTSGKTRAQIKLKVACRLLETNHAYEASSILAEDQDTGSYDAAHRSALMYFYELQALQRGDYDTAWSLASAECSDDRIVSLSLAHRTVAAEAAHGLRQTTNARDLLEQLMPDVDALGSTATRRDIYRIAGKITGDPRFEQEAKELTQLLKS